MVFQVMAALILLIASAAERIVEMVASPILEKYGIEARGIRTGIMVFLVFLVNFALMRGLNLDPISELLNQNQSLVNIGIAAFAATNLSSLSHSLQQYLGKRDTLIEIAQTAIDAAEELD